MALVYGVGTNDADYVTQVLSTVGYINGKQKRKLVWGCPFHTVWKRMLERGFSEKKKLKCPTYRDATVCKEWFLFSTFKAWMEQQDWEGKHLDKDLLVQGNKLYSPDTCVFVSPLVNTFMVDCGASRGKYMIGVSWDRHASKFRVSCHNPFSKKGENLGLFVNELEGHNAWLKRKLEHAYVLAALQTDARVARAIINRYESYNVQGLLAL